MTDNRLLELAERVEAATGPDRELDTRIFESCDDLADWCKGPKGWAEYLPIHENDPPSLQSLEAYLEAHAPHYTASLDAAKTLYVYVPERIPSDPRLATAQALRARANGEASPNSTGDPA